MNLLLCRARFRLRTGAFAFASGGLSSAAERIGGDFTRRASSVPVLRMPAAGHQQAVLGPHVAWLPDMDSNHD